MEASALLCAAVMGVPSVLIVCDTKTSTKKVFDDLNQNKLKAFNDTQTAKDHKFKMSAVYMDKDTFNGSTSEVRRGRQVLVIQYLEVKVLDKLLCTAYILIYST